MSVLVLVFARGGYGGGKYDTARLLKFDDPAAAEAYAEMFTDEEEASAYHWGGYPGWAEVVREIPDGMTELLELRELVES